MADLRHYVEIKAPLNVVYSAITDQDGLARWWTTDVKAEPVEDSVSEFKFGENYHNFIRILDLQPNKRVEWLVEKGDKQWIGTRIVFRLMPMEGGTILRFSHLNWLEITDFFASCNYQWAYYLRSLKLLCETGEGTPYYSD